MTGETKKTEGGFVTYGKEPVQIQLQGDDTVYVIGSEVGNYLRMFRGKLYKRFPGLYRRTATDEEREYIKKTSSDPNHANLPSSVSLMKASEVEEVMAGRGGRYRHSNKVEAIEEVEEKVENYASMQSAVPGNSTPNIGRRSSLAPIPQTNTSVAQHLDPVPLTTPCLIYAKNKKKVRSYPMFLNSNVDHHVINNADQEECLVPIRLDMELEGHKLRDCFTWNRNEKLISPEQFAELMCDDMNLPPGLFVRAIAESIRVQCDQYQPSEDVLKEASDARVILKLNVHIGNISIVDQIEWDMAEETNDPEVFAKQYCKELGLGGEFITTIAYSIRGQLTWHQKTCSFSDNPLPVVSVALRNTTEADVWSPQMEILTDQDLAKKTRNQDRNTRRLRRVVRENY